MIIRSLILAILTVILSSCASAPISVLALERPEGIAQTQVNQDTNFCNDVSFGSQAVAVDCMQRRGYRLVKVPAR